LYIPHTAHGLTSATSQALKANLEAEMVDVKGIIIGEACGPEFVKYNNQKS
jgi:hypothetical protein